MAIGAYSGVDALSQSAISTADAKRKEKELQKKVQIQKKEMASEFEEQLKAAEERAKKKAKKGKGLFKALNFAGMFMGPIGQALTGAISGGLQAKQQRDALKELMKCPQFKKYKGTFLGDLAEQQLDAAKDMQQASGAALLAGVLGGAGGFLGGKALGGEGMKSGFFKDVFKSTPQAGAGLWHTAGSGASDMMNLANPSMRMGIASTKATPFKTFFQNVGQKINPMNMQENMAGLIQSDSNWLNKIMRGAQGMQNIRALQTGSENISDIIELLTKASNPASYYEEENEDENNSNVSPEVYGPSY